MILRDPFYAWCPLPIIDFAMQGHVDVLAITFSLLAVGSSISTRRGSRILTDFLIGMATLAKFYPLLLLVVIIRRRDWVLLLTCLGTISIGYVPCLFLGDGQVLDFFPRVSERPLRVLDQRNQYRGTLPTVFAKPWELKEFFMKDPFRNSILFAESISEEEASAAQEG